MVIKMRAISPPTPKPVLLAMLNINGIIITPAISKLLGGKTFLCEQMLFVQIEN
jgi:hypothetical protein